VAGLECDALALIVVRLSSAEPPSGALAWHACGDAAGASPHGLSAEASTNPRFHAPFRSYENGDSVYFSPHVTRVLCPQDGSRRVCCPDDLQLEIAHNGGPARTARIELVERITSPLDLGGNFGLIHLSLRPSEEEEAPDTLSWASALRTTYLKPTNKLRLHLVDQGEKTELEDRPLRRLAEELFGDPHLDLERHFYTALMASYPAGAQFLKPALKQEWRHALAIRSYELSEKRKNPYELKKEADQTIRIADADVLVLRNCTVLATLEPIGGMAANYFRAYWAESLVFGLLQQAYMERFQARLAELGALPHRGGNHKLESLHDSWLAFRNTLWWSQPSSSADPPRELLTLLRRAQGTDLLFRDLEEDMATYSDLHHREIEDRQARALNNLQVYGSGAAVLSTLATAGALFDFTQRGAATFVVLAATASIVVALLVYLALRHD
jgi:hypothetical protein